MRGYACRGTGSPPDSMKVNVWGQLMEDNGYFSKVRYADSILDRIHGDKSISDH